MMENKCETLSKKFSERRKIREKDNKKLMKKSRELSKMIFEMNKDVQTITISILSKRKSFDDKRKKNNKVDGIFFERKDFEFKDASGDKSE